MGGWKTHPESENERNGRAAQGNVRHLQRGKKTGGDRMREWSRQRGETKRRKGKQRAQGGTPAGQWSDCASVGHWEGAPPAEASPALQPTSEN